MVTGAGEDAVSGVSAYIYIYHLGLKFNLPTLPEQLTETLPIQFNNTAILSRSAPLVTFSSAGPRTLNIQINLHRQLFSLDNNIIEKAVKTNVPVKSPNGGLTWDGLTSVTQTQKFIRMPDPVTGGTSEVPVDDATDYLIRALLSLSLPKYLDTPKAIIPPSVLIRYGNELCIRGVPSNVTKTSSGPWLKNGKQAIVSISFMITETEPYSAQFVAKNGSLRSISTTLERSSVWMY